MIEAPTDKPKLLLQRPPHSVAILETSKGPERAKERRGARVRAYQTRDLMASELISLIIKVLDSREYEISVSARATVPELKDEIARATNIAAQRQRIIYLGKVRRGQ